MTRQGTGENSVNGKEPEKSVQEKRKRDEESSEADESATKIIRKQRAEFMHRDLVLACLTAEVNTLTSEKNDLQKERDSLKHKVEKLKTIYKYKKNRRLLGIPHSYPFITRVYGCDYLGLAPDVSSMSADTSDQLSTANDGKLKLEAPDAFSVQGDSKGKQSLIVEKNDDNI